MKFERVPEHLLGSLFVGIGSLRAAAERKDGVRCLACWKAEHADVIVISREWTRRHTNAAPGCSVDVYVDRLYAVGFSCAVDGSVSYVANEVLEILGGATGCSYDDLKQMLVSCRLAMASKGRMRITLPIFHRYKEAQ